jgi:PKD repeat protein
LASLTEGDVSTFDMGSYEFAHSGCAWCHPGGGPMEYDREGYRYDERPSGMVAGGLANPSKEPGDYFTFDPVTKTLVDKSMGTNGWKDNGVSEIDCYMCHLVPAATTLNPDYRNLERNFGTGNPATTAPMAMATYGLANTGLLTGITLGQNNTNPSITSFVWSSAFDSPSVPGADVTTATANQGPPPKENCAVCHFPDKSRAPDFAAGETCVTNPEKCGPASKPLGFTAWQKFMAAGSTDDGDELIGVNGKDGKNDAIWKVAKGRVEGGKRGESLNDPNNPDVHMDRGMQCYDCHYLLGRDATKSEVLGDGIGNDDGICNAGEACTAVLEDDPEGKHTYPALTDASGNVIQPSIEVWKADHQFAKGDSTPDGKNMDQLDNTVTCASCHIDRTHPNLTYDTTDGKWYLTGTTKEVKQPTHAGFPAFHFERISCKTCHIPYMDGPVDQIAADFTTGPYQTFERTQVTEAPMTGIGQRPLYLQRVTDHGNGHVEIQPLSIMSVTVWANAVTQVGEECGSIVPTFQRLGKGAAEALRTMYGDVNADGVYDWTLNRAQGGDTALIVNTQQEIKDMTAKLVEVSGNPSLRPVMNFYFNQFSISHNIRPRNATTNRILGSERGGGCVMCHSSSDPTSPTYSTNSVGFFDKSYMLFRQPNDGGKGLVQTSVTDSVGTLERINIKFTYTKPDETSASVNLSNADGETVSNTISQGEVLGYDPSYLAILKSPEPAGIPRPIAALSWFSDKAVSRQVNFDASSSTCGGICTYTWDFGDSTNETGISVSHQYGTAGLYPVTLTVTDTQYGMSDSVTVEVLAKTVNTAPVASRTTLAVSGMTVSFTDTSTDAEDLPEALSVLVQWGDGTVSTGKGGDAFSHTYTLGGTYTIRHSVTDTGGLKSSSPNVSVTIAEKYSISGTVTEAGAGLAGATVYLKQGTTTKRTATTAANGTYSFANLLKGCYYVIPAMTGKTFTPVQQTMCVGPSATGIDFTSP